MNGKNSLWINTPFNRRLAEFFLAYKEGEGAFNPLPFFEESLLFKDRTFQYLKEHDPTEAIEKIFHALIFSHAKVVKDTKGLGADAAVNASDTFIGKYITSVIYTFCTFVCTYMFP